MVPRSLGTMFRPNCRLAAAIYMARMIGAGPLMVIETEKCSSPSAKPA